MRGFSTLFFNYAVIDTVGNRRTTPQNGVIIITLFTGVPGIITVVWVICNSQLNKDKCWNHSFELSIAWIVMAPIVTALTV